MNKLIKFYNVDTGIVCFVDGTKRQFSSDAMSMIDKMIHMLAKNDSNFSPPDLATEDGVDVAIDMLTK